MGCDGIRVWDAPGADPISFLISPAGQLRRQQQRESRSESMHIQLYRYDAYLCNLCSPVRPARPPAPPALAWLAFRSARVATSSRQQVPCTACLLRKSNNVVLVYYPYFVLYQEESGNVLVVK